MSKLKFDDAHDVDHHHHHQEAGGFGWRWCFDPRRHAQLCPQIISERKMRAILRSLRRGTSSPSQVEESGAVAPVFGNSPSIRRTGSSSLRLASKEGRGSVTLLGSKWKSYYFSARRWLPWLVLICLWSYIGFHMQTRWVGWEQEEIVKLETIDDQSSRTSLTITASSTVRGRSSSSSSSLDLNNSEAVVNEDLSGVVVVAGQENLSFKTWLFNCLSWWRQEQQQQQLDQRNVAKAVVEQQEEHRPKPIAEKEPLVPLRTTAGEEGGGVVHVDSDLPRESSQQQNGDDHTAIEQTSSDNNLTTSDQTLKRSSEEDDEREEEKESLVGDGGIHLLKAAAVASEGGGTLGSNVQGEILVAKHNSSQDGRLVGPFNYIMERQVPGLLRQMSPRRRMCKREGLFPEFVKGKNIVVVFHELSMTGAPLAMLELASEMVRCGGKVSAVVLNKKGGLYKELLGRGVMVVRDKFSFSWNAAAKADLVIAGSAACNTWIGQYLHFNKKGSERLVWWVMENRREYFDKAKLLLGKARALVFLSETQEQLWRNWASQEALSLPSIVAIVGLSVNDDLAAVAGLAHPTGPAHRNEDKESLKAEKNRLDLRNKVRTEMGLDSTDFLVIALSSINPGKGQLMLIQAALMVEEGIEDEGLEGLRHVDPLSLDESNGRSGNALRKLFGLQNSVNCLLGRLCLEKETEKARKGSIDWKKEGGESSWKADIPGLLERRVLLRKQPETQASNHSLKILLGSVGSKSNKPEYLERIYGLLDRHPRLANMVLWTPATVHVSPLYVAADAYVMNAQGIGETFGRVTIEAMAFGLPVLGTDAGGTKEILESNMTGVFHPVGKTGIPVLARHLRWLLDHPDLGIQMGEKGRERVSKMFREGPMYDKLARIFIDCVREQGG